MVKNLPMRTCIGCYEAKPKKELIRIVKTADNEVSIDFIGKQSGRGAYICHNIACLEKAVKTRRLSKTFSMQISDEIYASLREKIEAEKE